MQKVLVIVGPTSSGKSTLAVELAKQFNGEVISADSRQVYRGLDIATGKITKRGMKGVPHHLLDVASPKRTFTANDFVKKGRAAIKDIAARGKLPIICGGTGFYIDALLGTVVIPEVAPNKELRKKLGALSAPELFKRLKKIDPERAESIDRENSVRLVRAIEIAHELGTVPKKASRPQYNALVIGIEWPKEKLRARIEESVYARMRRGMVAEAKQLHESGLSYKRMQELGLEYRLLAHYLQHKISKTEMLQKIAQGDTQYARRQMQYWKRNGTIRWYTPANRPALEREVRGWLAE